MGLCTVEYGWDVDTLGKQKEEECPIVSVYLKHVSSALFIVTCMKRGKWILWIILTVYLMSYMNG